MFMQFNSRQQNKKEPSEKSKMFTTGQSVSFVYRKEIRSGEIATLLVNSAVIYINDSALHKEHNEKTVIGYDKLLSIY